MYTVKRFIKRSAFVAAVAMIITALLGQTAMAGTITSSFSAELAADAKASAAANAVALGGVDITGKVLLQEYRATASDATKTRMAKPTIAQIQKYGTIVRSAQQGQAVLKAEVKTYQTKVVKAEKRVKIIKIKLKRADSKADKKTVKKVLKKAKKKVRVMRLDKDWKFRPLLRLPRGTGFENSGLENNNEGRGFWYVVGEGEHNEDELIMGWDPAESEARVVALVLPNGSVIDGCLNFVDWEIDIHTIDYSLVVMVKTFIGLKLEVSGNVGVAGQLNLYGEMRNDGVVCDTDQKSIKIDESAKFGPILVEASSTKEALLIGEKKVQLNDQIMAEAKGSVEGAVLLREKGTLQMACETGQPVSTISIDEGNDLDLTDPNCEGTRAECESFTVLSGHLQAGTKGTLTVGSNFGSALFSNGTQADFRDDFRSMNVEAGAYTPELRLNAPTELPPTRCINRPDAAPDARCATVTLTFTPAGGGEVATASTEFVMNKVVAPPL